MSTAEPTAESAYNPVARTAARLACVQALYEMDVTGAELDGVLGEFMARRWRLPIEGDDGREDDLTEPDTTFFTELLRGTAAHMATIDEMLSAVLQPDWTMERLEVLLRAILRAGVFELAHRPDIPAGAVINEYMDVAHAFFDGGEPKLVNGVLDKLAKTLRQS